MRIRTKLIVLVLGVVFSMGIISMAISVNSMRQQSRIELQATKNTLLTHKKEMLKIVIDNAYAVIETAHREANDPEKLTGIIKNRLENAVDLAFGSLTGIYQQENLSENEAKQQAKKTISSLRYDDTNYFWLVTLDLTMISDPLHPKWEGKNISGIKDIKGNPIFPNLLEKGKKEKKVFFDYIWTKPGTEEPASKIAYARVFEPWGWAIGSGMLMEVAEEGIQKRAKDVVGSLRYGPQNDDYFWIHSTKSKMVMHPFKPELNGKDLSNIQDPNKKYLFREMVAVCEKQGEGFVEYLWPKPGEKDPVQKISYVKLFEPYGWIVGTGIYVDDIQKKIAVKKGELSARLVSNIIKQSLLLFAVCAVILVITIFTARKISLPLHETSKMLKDIAEGDGDLTKRIQLSTKDETGELANWFNVFVDKLQQMIAQIGENAGSLEKSATDMFTISGNMNSGAARMSEKTDNANMSAENMSSNIQSIASAMEQTSTNINIIANSTDGMSSTINELTENTQKAREVSQDAVEQSQMATENVKQLSSVAQEIGNITEVITEISEQTNLLALNATIEAARAGEAGKGFAVVANEIKALASQTSEATLKIKDQITQIQDSSSKADDNIGKISEVIEEVNGIVSTIAAAIEEQSVTTREIAENVNQSSQGISEININLAKSTSNAEEITSEISDVNSSARDIVDSSSKVNKNAEYLNQLALQLNEMVGRFKV